MNESDQLAQALYHENLYNFARRAFEDLNPGVTFSGDRYVRAICYALERVYRGEVKRLIITLPPRHLKSQVASVAFPAWVLGQDPSERLICASYAASLSETFGYQSRFVMQQPWYKATFPKTRFSSAKPAVDEQRTTRNGWRISTSTGGTLTGKGGDIILIDDAMKAEDAHSETKRESTWSWFCNTVISRLDNQKEGAIVVVAQRLHEDDLIGRLLQQENWEVLHLPAIEEEDQIVPIADGLNWARKTGVPLDSARVGLDELARIKLELGTNAFEAQYMLRPTLPGGNLIKLDWFGRYQGKPDRSQYEAIVQSWDVAAIPGETNDWCVCTTWGMVGRYVDLLHAHRKQHILPDLMNAATGLDKVWQPSLILVEKASSGIGLGQSLRDLGLAHVHALDPRGSKVLRMSLQSPKLERGEVRLPTAAPWLKGFLDEVLAFPNGKHDDQVDTMSQILKALDRRPREIRGISRYKN
ncbi:MAG: phage terminase large subunit [Marinosulfonomonas sp.]|nr:phage terminase large subunit [Marinosulfonomonas sp.]